MPARTEGARTRVRMSGPERREQLITVARSVFAERGYVAASVEEIAERADVSKPVVYEHFGGKDGLYQTIIGREITQLVERITRTLDAPSPHQALHQAADAFLGYIEEHREGFRILLRDAPFGGDGGSMSGVIADIAAQVEGLLAKELGARGYDRKIAPVMARALVGMVAMTGEWWLDVGSPSRKVVAAHLVNLAWNGLKDLDKDPVKNAKRS
ncbi:MAG: TetR/AcrR family transcriptional regulator [Actinomycetota bacterium]